MVLESAAESSGVGWPQWQGRTGATFPEIVARQAKVILQQAQSFRQGRPSALSEHLRKEILSGAHHALHFRRHSSALRRQLERSRTAVPSPMGTSDQCTVFELVYASLSAHRVCSEAPGKVTQRAARIVAESSKDRHLGWRQAEVSDFRCPSRSHYPCDAAQAEPDSRLQPFGTRRIVGSLHNLYNCHSGDSIPVCEVLLRSPHPRSSPGAPLVGAAPGLRPVTELSYLVSGSGGRTARRG